MRGESAWPVTWVVCAQREPCEGEGEGEGAWPVTISLEI